MAVDILSKATAEATSSKVAEATKHSLGWSDLTGQVDPTNFHFFVLARNRTAHGSDPIFLSLSLASFIGVRSNKSNFYSFHYASHCL